MRDHDSELELLKVMLEFESLVDCHEHAESTLGHGDQLVVREISPLGLGDREHLMGWEGLAHSRVNALIYEDAHEMSCSLASSKNPMA